MPGGRQDGRKTLLEGTEMTNEEKVAMVLKTLNEISESEIQRIRCEFAEDDPAWMDGSVEDFKKDAADYIVFEEWDFGNRDIKETLDSIREAAEEEEEEDFTEEPDYNPMDEVLIRAILNDIE